MQLSDYEKFPTILPIIAEDEFFFYPFMISPIFLTSQQDIDAVTEAMEKNSLSLSLRQHQGKKGSEVLRRFIR